MKTRKLLLMILESVIFIPLWMALIYLILHSGMAQELKVFCAGFGGMFLLCFAGMDYERRLK